MELISPNECIVDQVDSNKPFDETQIQTDPLKLSKMILDVDITFLKEYFDENAWVAVQNLIKMVSLRYTCKTCNTEARILSIECKKCHSIFHLDCKNVSFHYRETPKNWTCKECY